MAKEPAKESKIKRVIRAGGVILSITLSVLILIYGKHDPVLTAGNDVVDPSYELYDGDLDFGYLSSDKPGSQPDTQPGQQGTAAPTSGVDINAGTEEKPLTGSTEQFEYSVVKGLATLTLSLEDGTEEIVIPESIDGYQVVKIGEYCFQNFGKLKKITIPEGIREISYNAFENCALLERLELPASLTVIRDSAFWNCSALTELTLPPTLKTVEPYAFYACDNLTELTVANTAGLSDIMDLSVIQRITVSEGTSLIAADSFEGCESLIELKLPSSLTTIKDYAFSGCTALPELVLPSGIVSIGENAFEECDSLTQVVLPSELILLGEYAFYSCDSLETVVIPAGIQQIGPSVFDDCDNLVLLVTAGTAGEEYAIANDLRYEAVEP